LGQVRGRRIGEILVAEGLLSEGAVQRALEFQQSSTDRVKLGTILLEWDLLAEETLLESLAKLHRCPPVTWEMLSAAGIWVVRLLPGRHAIRLSAIPYAAEKGSLHVAFANPSDLAILDEVSAITGKRVLSGITSEVRLLQAHQQFYGRHIPLGFRSVVQKLGCETRRRRVPGTRIGLERGGPGGSPEGSFVAEDDFAEFLSITLPEIPLPSPAPWPTPIPIASSERLSGEASVVPSRREAPTPFEREPAFQDDPKTQSSTDASAPETSDRWTGASSPLPRLPLAPAAPQGAPAKDSFGGMWQPARHWSESLEVAAPALWIGAEREPPPPSIEARSREEIGDAILGSHLTEIPRVILLGVGGASIAGWRGRGPNLSPERVEALRISAAEKSLFARVAESGVPHFGRVGRENWPQALRDLLGVSPLDCAVFPVRVLDGVAAFLYADRLGEPMRPEDFEAIWRAAGSASNVLSRFLLQYNGTPPVA
jgi:hypothetical protein